MLLNQKTMISLAAISVIVSMMIMRTNGHNKPDECCKAVSKEVITLPITGFKLQKRDPPCVNAVIFFTTEGLRCSHWRERWVKTKIQEFKRLQLKELAVNINTTDSTPLSTAFP